MAKSQRPAAQSRTKNQTHWNINLANVEKSLPDILSRSTHFFYPSDSILDLRCDKLILIFVLALFFIEFLGLVFTTARRCRGRVAQSVERPKGPSLVQLY